MTLTDVVDILRAAREQGLTEVRIQTAGFTLRFRRPRPAEPAQGPGGAAAAAPPVAVGSPAVGIFRGRPVTGGLEPISVGTLLEPDDVIGTIESVRRRYGVRAAHRGRVVEVCVRDGEPVEFGTALIRLVPVAKAARPPDGMPMADEAAIQPARETVALGAER